MISSQIELHKLYGGVVPEIASRKHIEKNQSGNRGSVKGSGGNAGRPGRCWRYLWSGACRRAACRGCRSQGHCLCEKKLPLVGVHHIEGHVSANYIEHPDLEPPFLCLIVSGGHTHLVIVKDYGEFEILGRTRDDAAGEAFDKVARAIGLGYPGGPKIDKLSKEGNPDAIQFPRAKVGDCPYDFSFSGVKSAVLNYLNQAQMKGEEVNRADLAASFQKAVVDVLVEHTMMAAKDFGDEKMVAIAGGVASNGTLRARYGKKACEENGYQFFRPSPIFCTDNAAMIGVAAYYEYKKRNPPWMGSECSAESETGRKIKTFGEVFMERKNTAIVLAAGQGKRMNSKVQKQFLELGGKPLLYYSLKCFQDSGMIRDIILVTGAESVPFWQRGNCGKIWSHQGDKSDTRWKREI